MIFKLSSTRLSVLHVIKLRIVVMELFGRNLDVQCKIVSVDSVLTVLCIHLLRLKKVEPNSEENEARTNDFNDDDEDGVLLLSVYTCVVLFAFVLDEEFA